MESAFQKIGLYEIVGVLLTGMTAILFGLYLEIPVINADSIDSDVMKALLFLVASYYTGIILQEISAWVDSLVFRFQDDFKSDFLNSRVWKNKLELNDFIRIANAILNKEQDNSVFSKDEQLYVFFYCKDYLEVRGKDWKPTVVESLSDMSKGLMVAFPCMLAYSLFNSLLSSSRIDYFLLLVLALLTILSYNRAKKYALMRIRAIFRHYKMLSQF